ncbi:ABC transporter permease [Sutcliffiella deserti]|uniref:ABC transporter permease n=1 Tax=Sutcliffiella deserti TaxID=2875501 RepID=UPI001CBECA0B|nr:ABC transporter permease [Sutcliffiella deserti]
MFLAIRELSSSKLKYILVGVILTAILFLLFFMNGLASGLSNADSSSIKNLPADFVMMNETADGNLTKSEIDEGKTQKIYEQIDVNHSTPLTITMSSIKSDGQLTDVVYFALNPHHNTMPNVMEGKPVNEISNNEVIVDSSIKNQGYDLHDTFYDENLGVEFKIVGFFENQTLNHLPVVYTSISHWKERELRNHDKNNAILYYGEQVELQGYDVLTVEETVNAIPGYSETQGSLLMMITFLFIISAFISTVFFYVITIQKSNQFGVLKAIGANTRFIAKGIIMQVVLITFISFGFSLISISGMTQLLPAEMPFELSISLILLTGLLFLILNIVGSLLSVYRIAKVDALEAIGRVD